jgi:hypothetical protein
MAGLSAVTMFKFQHLWPKRNSKNPEKYQNSINAFPPIFMHLKVLRQDCSVHRSHRAGYSAEPANDFENFLTPQTNSQGVESWEEHKNRRL